ncbi:hypothetical protein Tco_0497713 [Tanacetum coccineum]
MRQPSLVHNTSPPHRHRLQVNMHMDDLRQAVPTWIFKNCSLGRISNNSWTMGMLFAEVSQEIEEVGKVLKGELVLSTLRGRTRGQGRKSQDDTLDSSRTWMVSSYQQNQGLLTREGDTREEKRLRERVVSADFQEEVDAGADNTGNEQVSTVGAKKSTSSVDKGQREGKAPMISEETPKKSKEQILQEEASLAEAIRLDSLQKEEEAKQIHLDSLLAQRIAEEEELNEQQKQRKAQVQFEAQQLQH